ncbi:MAG TPA: methionine synthase [Candidatus Atribacteria bacterium]|nr:methionine synthase [Candidatus Atribacteria bacterium]
MKKILGASLVNCVHVAGIYRFLSLAEQYGYQTYFLGPAISIEKLIEAIKEEKPERVIVGYRLSEEAARNIFQELKEALQKNQLLGKFVLILSCTPSLQDIAQKTEIFDYMFTGKERFEEIVQSITGEKESSPEEKYPSTLPERIKAKSPFPLLRHHFGLPSLSETIEGVAQISEARVIDVISLGPDQNAQEFFFQPHLMNEEKKGAGGVPLRHPEDLKKIYQASRRGNFPLLRCYSGTNNLVEWAHLLKETINIAWGAVPLMWYSKLDGRSQRSLSVAIRENQEAMRAYASLGVPLEVNESHQWSLRDAPDSVAAATFYLAAYNAKKVGTRYYIAQYMLNTPPGISPQADLAKMLAKSELIQELEEENFAIFTQTRGGLAHFSVDLNVAKGQLGASTFLGLFLKPQIIHVVGFCEADHLAHPEEVIESAQIVEGVIKDALFGLPQVQIDPVIVENKERVKREAKLVLEAIKKLGEKEEDPWASPQVLTQAVEEGILDAPHLLGNLHAPGKVKTRIIDGFLRIVNERGEIIKEEERLNSILQRLRLESL